MITYKKIDAERKTNDILSNAYVIAFGVPVCYVNSVGRMDHMLGRTGKMMRNAGFKRSGLSKTYCSCAVAIQSGSQEPIGIDIELIFKDRTKDIRFYGDDIIKGNVLFRRLILKSDIRAGIRFYERMKDSL